MRDELFKNYFYKKNFTFDKKTTEVFDNMLQRSIPFYLNVIHWSKQFLYQRIKNNDLIYDFGCSTGTFLFELAKILDKKVDLIGIDISKSMIGKSKEKQIKYFNHGKKLKTKIKFICENFFTMDLQPCMAITMFYTLQFVPPNKQIDILKKIYYHLHKGGILILSEKTIESGDIINQYFLDQYHLFKKNQAYSDIEITRKRKSLEKILISRSLEEHLLNLKKVGFSEVSLVFKWFNFATFFAIK
jgi:tRNA (cmo5U34)-methyltransferase